MTYTEFYQQFSVYSTVDLLMIIRDKENYQAEAVKAAEGLLREREVSAADEGEVERNLADREAVAQAKVARVESYKVAAADWVQPMVHPTAEVNPRKWYRLFLVVYGLWYVYIWYQFLRGQVFSRYHDFGLQAIGAAGILWESLILVFIIKKHRWGWILLVAENTVLAIVRVAELIRLFRYVREGYRPGTAVWFILFHLAFVFFFWRDEVADFFGVEQVEKKRTIGVALVLGLSLFIIGVMA